MIKTKEVVDDSSIIKNKESISLGLEKKLQDRKTPAALRKQHILQIKSPLERAKVEAVKIGILKKEKAVMLSDMLQQHLRKSGNAELKLAPISKSEQLLSPRSIESYSIKNYKIENEPSTEEECIEQFATNPKKVIII